MDNEIFDTELKPLLLEEFDSGRMYRVSWKRDVDGKVFEIRVRYHPDEAVSLYIPETLLKLLKMSKTIKEAIAPGDDSVILAPYKLKVIDGPCMVYAPYIPVTKTGEIMKEDIMDITREICGSNANRY